MITRNTAYRGDSTPVRDADSSEPHKLRSEGMSEEGSVLGYRDFAGYQPG